MIDQQFRESIDWSVRWHDLPPLAQKKLNEILGDFSRAMNLPYIATLKQMQAHTHPARGVSQPLFYGGAMGGAKSSYLSAESIRDSREVDGNRWFLCRLTLAAFRDTTLDNLLELIDWGGPGHEFSWNKNEHTFYRRANGSEIRYGQIGTEADIKRHGSAQFGGIGIDEAPEIQERLFFMMLTRIRLPAAEQRNRIKVRLTGNPWPGWIEQKFIKRPEDGFQTIRAYVTDNPHISPAYIEGLRRVLPAPLFQAWLEGSWDFSAPMNVAIPPDLLGQMLDRVDIVDDNDCVWGVDVGITHDKTVVAQRHGMVFGILREWVGRNTSESASDIRDLYISSWPKPQQINVDVDGLGHGVQDRLEEYQMTGELPQSPELTIKGVHAQSSAYLNQEADNPFRYGNVKSENTFKLRDLLESGRGQLLPDPETGEEDYETVADLTTPVWERRNSRIFIEDKKTVKVRLGRSPDRGDAVSLTMYTGSRDELETFGTVANRRVAQNVELAGFETYDQELNRLSKDREAREAIGGVLDRWKRGEFRR